MMRSAGVPVILEVSRQSQYSRWLPILKPLLALPHVILLTASAVLLVLLYLGSAVSVIATGRYPRKLFAPLSAWLAWAWRILAYVCLLTDTYPRIIPNPKSTESVGMQIYLPPGGRVGRWRPFVAWVLVLGQLMFLPVVYASLALMVALAFFSILFTRMFSCGIFDFIVDALRFNAWLIVYCLFMTEQYPGIAMRPRGKPPLFRSHELLTPK